MNDCPPVLIGEKVWWLGSGSGLPKKGVVRWIGRLAEIGPDWALGIELEEGLPYGGVDGSWRGRQLFQCRPKHGLIVPSDRIISKGGRAPGRETSGQTGDADQEEGGQLLLGRHRDFESVHREAVRLRSRHVMTRLDPQKKTNSGLFSLFGWLRKDKRELSGSSDTLLSTATAASFSFVHPAQYRRPDRPKKWIFSGPESDSYRNRVRKRYEDKSLGGNVSLREKYNLYGSGSLRSLRDSAACESLPTTLGKDPPRAHRRTVSESAKYRRKWVHVKGKRRAPPPPSEPAPPTLRKKRKAPPPPAPPPEPVPCTDTLRLERGRLAPGRMDRRLPAPAPTSPLSPRPWYKRNPGPRKDPEPLQDWLETGFPRRSSALPHDKFNIFKLDRDKRKSQISILTNISELDREAAEIIKRGKERESAFLASRNEKYFSQPVEQPLTNEPEQESQASTKELITLFNSITNVTKVTVNSKFLDAQAFKKEDRRISVSVTDKKVTSREVADSGAKEFEIAAGPSFQSKSGRDENGRSSVTIEEVKEETSPTERKTTPVLSESGSSSSASSGSSFRLRSRASEKRPAVWVCPRCTLENPLWRSTCEACHSCRPTVCDYSAGRETLDGATSYLIGHSRVVPTSPGRPTDVSKLHPVTEDARTEPNEASRKDPDDGQSEVVRKARLAFFEKNMKEIKENSATKESQTADCLGPAGKTALSEKLKLRELLKEMKNSLPKNLSKMNSFRSREEVKRDNVQPAEEPKKAEAYLVKTETVVEEIRVRKDKVSSSSQTSSRVLPADPKPSHSPVPGPSRLLQSVVDPATPSQPPSTPQSPLSKLEPSKTNLVSPRFPSPAPSNTPKGISENSLHQSKLTPASSEIPKEPHISKKPTDSKTTNSSSISDFPSPRLMPLTQSKLTQAPSKHSEIPKEPHLSKKATNSKTNSASPSITSPVGSPSFTPKLQGSTENSLAQTKLTQASPKHSEIPKESHLSKKPTNSKINSAGPSITSPLGSPSFTPKLQSSTEKSLSQSKLSPSSPKHSVIHQESLLSKKPTDSKTTNSGSSSISNFLPPSPSRGSTENSLAQPKLTPAPPKHSKIPEESLLSKKATDSKANSSGSSNTSPLGSPSYTPKTQGSTANSYAQPKLTPASPKHSEISEESLLSKKATDCKANSSGSSNTSPLGSPSYTPKTQGSTENSLAQPKLTPASPKHSDKPKEPHLSKQATDSKATNSPKSPDPSGDRTNNLAELNGKPLHSPKPVHASKPSDSPTDPLELNKMSRDPSKPTKGLSKLPPEPNIPNGATDPPGTSGGVQEAPGGSVTVPGGSVTVPGGSVTVPVVVEEYRLGADGRLDSSVGRDCARIDLKRVELMRPRDWTEVAATRSETRREAVYANAPREDALPLPRDDALSLPQLPPCLASPREPQPGPSRLTESGLLEEEYLNTMALNRLLRRLEAAISRGEHLEAAGLAQELARLRVPCSVVRQRAQPSDITIDLYVEDKATHRGPVGVRVKPWLRLGDLMAKVERELDIPVQLQRWIVNKNLASDPRASLTQLGVSRDHTPVFLYLVAPDAEVKEGAVGAASSPKSPPPAAPDSGGRSPQENGVSRGSSPESPGTRAGPDGTDEESEDRLENYRRLVALEERELVPSSEPFQCPVCLADCPPAEGVVLRECLHTFCRGCLADTIKYSEEPQVSCPFRDSSYACHSALLQREIKALVPREEYEVHLAKSIALAEAHISNAFHCRSADCKGWCIYEDKVNLFHCPVCGRTNCLTCQAIHEGLDCKQYQEQLSSNAESDEGASRTKQMLQEMVERGEAMTCPQCKVILMKKWGCDWLRCSMCKTEICWVTRGPRWGPSGKGDVSGGCQCGVNGVKCHPRCNYCH